MNFLLGFFSRELWLLLPMFICIRGVLCLASALLPALCVPMPTGCLGVCPHVVRRLRKFSLSPLAYPVGAEKATKSAKLAERQNPPPPRRWNSCSGDGGLLRTNKRGRQRDYGSWIADGWGLVGNQVVKKHFIFGRVGTWAFKTSDRPVTSLGNFKFYPLYWGTLLYYPVPIFTHNGVCKLVLVWPEFWGCWWGHYLAFFWNSQLVKGIFLKVKGWEWYIKVCCIETLK